MPRSDALTLFAQQLHATLAERVREAGPARDLVDFVGAALQQPARPGGGDGPLELPACRYLDAAITHAAQGPAAMPALSAALRRLAPQLQWQHSSQATGDPLFRAGHANTQIIGPTGLECRSDLVVGASLLTPHTVYPDHQHPPRELYLVMSEGDWFRTDAGWYTPGAGGTVYHPAGLTHAMRSGGQPLLAIWCLWPDPAR